MKSKIEINGEAVEIMFNEKSGAVMWSDNWPAVVDASRADNDSRFTRQDDGPGTFGSTSVLFRQA